MSDGSVKKSMVGPPIVDMSVPPPSGTAPILARPEHTSATAPRAIVVLRSGRQRKGTRCRRRLHGSSVGQAATSDERYMVVSTDGHVGPSVKGQLPRLLRVQVPRRLRPLRGGDGGTRTALVAVLEAAKPGEDENWCARQVHRRVGEGRGRAVREGGGIRNADQVDPRFLQRSYEASLLPGLQDHSARLADMDTAGVAAAVIYHGGLNGQSIPFSTTGLIAWGDSRYNHLEAVGVRIYNSLARRFRVGGARASCRHRPHPYLGSRGVRPGGRVGGRGRPQGHQPPGAAWRLPHAQRPGVGSTMGCLRRDWPVAQHARRRWGALPVQGPGCAGDVHDGDVLAGPTRRVGDDPRRRVRPPPGSRSWR